MHPFRYLFRALPAVLVAIGEAGAKVVHAVIPEKKPEKPERRRYAGVRPPVLRPKVQLTRKTVKPGRSSHTLHTFYVMCCEQCGVTPTNKGRAMFIRGEGLAADYAARTGSRKRARRLARKEGLL